MFYIEPELLRVISIIGGSLNAISITARLLDWHRHTSALHLSRSLLKLGLKKFRASYFRPSLKICVPKIFIGPLKCFVQFLVCFQSFADKLFASALLCCCIFTLVLTGTVQCVNLFFMTCWVIFTTFHEMKMKTKITFSLRPSSLLFRQTATGRTWFFIGFTYVRTCFVSVYCNNFEVNLFWTFTIEIVIPICECKTEW